MSVMDDTAAQPLRFVVPPEVAGRVHVHALKAAKHLAQLMAVIEHYDQLGAKMLARSGRQLPDNVEAARIRQRTIFDQLDATRSEILHLAADAKANGNDALRAARFAIDPKPDTTLRTPDPSDATQVMLTLHVMDVGLKRTHTTCATALRELASRLSLVPDPGALILASRLEALAGNLQPDQAGNAE